MKLTKEEKKIKRQERWARLRWKRYKGDHDYLMRVVQAPEGFRVLPFPITVQPGVPVGLLVE